MLSGLILSLLLVAADPGRGPRTELNFVPVLGGDSDVGVGGGVIGDLARLQPGYDPFRWRLEVGAFVTFKPGREGRKVVVPFQDYYLLLTMPQLTASRRLRIELRPSYTDEATQTYFGVGNSSPEPPPDLPRSRQQYQRRRLKVMAASRVQLAGHFFLRPAVDLTQNWIRVADDSLLGEQRRSAPPNVRSLIDGPLDHDLVAFELAAEYDSRDSETNTRTGSYHHLGVRWSPGIGPRFPFAYQQVNGTFRFYRSPFSRLVLSARVEGDVLFGNPPFYELTRVDDSSVLGGGKGIRGVPGQRYYGKIKLFGNFETRVELFRFSLRGKPFELGLAGFVDGGRVWADLRRQPALDGTGPGLKYGLGGGLRLQEGTTFVVRADLAWSPDARPVGAYFNAGQIF